MKNRFLFVLVITIGAMACSANKSTAVYRPSSASTNASSGNLVHFENSRSMSVVLDQAKKSNKPIFIDFYTTWCAPCKLMDQDVFTHAGTADMLNQNFVNCKVNAEVGNGPDLVTMFNITSFPTLLFLDENGKVLLRHEGAAYQQTMKDIAQIALSKHRS